MDINYSTEFIFRKDPLFFVATLCVFHVLVLVKWYNENNNKKVMGKTWELICQYKGYEIH